VWEAFWKSQELVSSSGSHPTRSTCHRLFCVQDMSSLMPPPKLRVDLSDLNQSFGLVLYIKDLAKSLSVEIEDSTNLFHQLFIRWAVEWMKCRTED
jgi:hypothetical protein